MTSLIIKRTGFQSSLPLSPEDDSNIFCHSFNGSVKWMRENAAAYHTI